MPSASPIKLVARRLRRIAQAIEGGYEYKLDDNVAMLLYQQLTTAEDVLKDYHDPTTKPRRRVRVTLDALSEAEIKVLAIVAKNKFATTAHIRDYYTDAHATDQLRNLEKMGLLYSHRYEAGKGRKSEKVYWPTRVGVNLVLQKYPKADYRYEGRYKASPPDEIDVHLKTMHHTLCYKAKHHGWYVVVPKIYNSANPLGNAPTPQARVLAGAVHIYHRNRNLPSTKAVPPQCNHYVLYKPDTEHAIVFFLCGENITSQFLDARVEEYEVLTDYIKVFGVFYLPQQATAWAKQANASGITVICHADIGQVLQQYKDDYL